MSHLPFPFVVGCGRSGSTLLRVMLDAHPDLVVPPESYFLEQIVRRDDAFVVDGRFDVAAFTAELFADVRFQTWGVAEPAVAAVLEENGPSDLAAAIRCVYRAAALAAGAVRYADKTPSYALCVPDLADTLPESVFVHLLRDPRDVAASYASANWGPRTLTSAAMAWRVRVGAAAAAGQRLGPSRYLEIRYEDLVAQPESTLCRICDFIELPFDPCMLDYETGDAARQTAWRDGGAHLGLLRPPTPGTRNWRTDMTPAQSARVGAVTDRLAARFGYEPSPPCRGLNRWRHRGERLQSEVEALSLRFRRTRLANRWRGPWRRLRGRGIPERSRRVDARGTVRPGL